MEKERSLNNDERAQLRAQLDEVEEKIKDAGIARDCLSNNGCYIAAENANNHIQELVALRDALQAELKGPS